MCNKSAKSVREGGLLFFVPVYQPDTRLACFLAKHALDFVLQRLLGGLNEMDMDDISGLADFSSDCWLSGSHLVLMCL